MRRRKLTNAMRQDIAFYIYQKLTKKKLGSLADKHQDLAELIYEAQYLNLIPHAEKLPRRMLHTEDVISGLVGSDGAATRYHAMYMARGIGDVEIRKVKLRLRTARPMLPHYADRKDYLKPVPKALLKRWDKFVAESKDTAEWAKSIFSEIKSTLSTTYVDDARKMYPKFSDQFPPDAVDAQFPAVIIKEGGPLQTAMAKHKANE